MKYPAIIRAIFVAAVFIIIPGACLHAESMGVSGGHDLDALWAGAQKQFELADHDGVFLLEGKHVSISAGGDMLTWVHRVVWIGTERGIDHYADLRIPYNSATSALKVVALRTWRDDTWWPDAEEISETAVVETLPFAVALADDYTSMRETMLLHDGVELPCIMETIYEIAERRSAADGTDGLYVFTRNDPAMLVECSITVPGGTEPRYRSGNGAPEPTVTRNDDGTMTYAWRMEKIDRRGSPSIEDPAVHEPYIVWSTWSDWSALGTRIVSSFDAAAGIDEALADTLAEHLKFEPTLAAKARKITALVDEYTRGIHYDSRFWRFSPRPATRTWETAYGHALDRAVLAAVLFREAGLQAEPLLRAAGLGGIDHDIPGLSRFEEPAVFVSDGGLHAFYDPSTGTLRDGPRALDGRIVWKPKREDAPSILPVLAGFEAESSFELILTLEPGPEGGWTGRGYLHTDGALCPYDEMVGLDGETLALIKKILGSILPGATAGGYNLEEFERTMVIAGFDVTVKPGEPDDHGRMRLSIGDPAGGIIDALPADVHLYDEHRSSPVVRFGTQMQQITLRLKPGDREIVHLPEAREIENVAGRFALTVERDDGWVTVDRVLKLSGMMVPPDAWPHLRALLLEETDAANRTILLKK
jgi:hypothetical protein